MATNSGDRLAIARLINRFGFGPKPGEFAALLGLGIDGARAAIMTPPINDAGLTNLADPAVTDLGPFPAPNTPQVVPFNNARNKQLMDITLWWLDRMVLADHGLTERMTWFWHGHWATSSGKVEYALPMYVQNQTLRKYGQANFGDMVQAMLVDPALLYWLDAGANTAKGPNENLARELMELFTLGVNHYSEDDIKAIAKSLTGWQVNRSAATVSFNPKLHDNSTITFLGNTGSYQESDIGKLLVERDDCRNFITNRIWFRFMDTNAPAPADLAANFAGRDIGVLMNALAGHQELANPAHAQVRSPVEWFVAACKALRLQPSKLSSSNTVVNYLDKLGQVPFQPPNVGGWPFDDAWLNISTAQYRITIANYLVGQGDLSPLNGIDPGAPMINALADWLGVAQFTLRTRAVLRDVTSNPKQLVVLALCSPEYIVSA